MGFDVNALDENGGTAISQFFRNSIQARFEETVDLFLNHPGSPAFNVDLLMEDLGKHFTFYGQKGLGPCVLLQIVKHIKFVPHTDRTNFANLKIFLSKVKDYTSYECRGSDGCHVCSTFGEDLLNFEEKVQIGL